MKQSLLLIVCALFALSSNAQILNPSFYGFETGDDGLAPIAANSGWGSNGIHTTKTKNNYTISDNKSNSGTYSLKFSGSGETGTAYSIYTTAGGTGYPSAITGGTYRLSYSIFIESGSDFTGSGNFEFRIKDTGYKNIGFDITALEQNKWVPVSILVDLPDYSSYNSQCAFRFVNCTGTGTFYIDDVQIEEVLPTTVQFNITQDASANGAPNVIIDDVQYKADQVVSENVSTTATPITLAAGTYDYVITSNGSDIYYGSVSLANGDEKVVDITMNAAQSGQFVFEYTDGSVKSTQKAIQVMDDQDRVVAIGKTNSGAGKFWAAGLTAGTYTYELDGLTGTFYCNGRNRSFNIEKTASSINMGLFNAVDGNIIDASVVLSDGSNDYNGVASASGDVSFGGDLFVNGTAGTTYNYTITATGYITKTGSFTTVTDVVDFYEIELESDGSTAIGDVNESKVNVYPNPASDIINVDCLVQSQVNIYNVTGQLILQKMAEGGVTPINVSNLQSGYYFVQISNKDYTEVVKVQVR